MKPHHVEDTTSVNRARKICLQLSIPLARFIEAMELSKQHVEGFEAKIQHTDRLTKDLEKDLYKTGITVKRIPREHPNTVCLACAKDVPIIGTQHTQKNYVQVCI